MTDKPKRIQRKRAKGWKMPEGAVYVGRGSKWGNPFPVPGYSREESLRRFTLMTTSLQNLSPGHYAELRGKDLACWCPVDKPCHADVLLEIANR